ncbi:hypothetical protein AJ80_09400 [Polytolypa hystricis UAMH7299]|uniref:Uncharacterized protein n=1 Tax=Polytolypa hystricis (strain UAMH7299) TaxID=1447883 RepID=A0A2B7WRC3_POLH7|nr:hypothetical protein AJ80_09400 [Polytolypa hystricis UAMH7299]
MVLRPTAETARMAGVLFSDFIGPYFRFRRCPVHIFDKIRILCDEREAVFEICDLGGQWQGVIGPKTLITVEQTLWMASEECCFGDLKKTLQALEKRVDYVPSDNYGQQMADLAQWIQHLKLVLEAPPCYELL